MFLTRTRPDIKLPVVFLSTRMQEPTVQDMQNLFRIIYYLNGTKELGLNVKPNSLNLYCSSDASFASHKDLKGHTGVTISLGNNNVPFHSSSKKQRLVSKSSIEADIIALDAATEEVICSRRIMEDNFH